MQLQQATNDVVMGNVGRTTKCGIRANAKAFSVLSNMIYQNKIGSIVREVSCNALDSHIMAGYPERQFTIHIPDALEPWFSVRDYGIGLDENGVRTVFSTFFESTKDQSNDTIGAFGLGSKTPFAYTDSFTVIAIHSGIRRVFTIFMAADGPECTIMDESPTDEGNGVEVQVAVTSEDDIPVFVREVRNQLAFFRVKPQIINYGDINFPDYFTSSSAFMECENVFVGGASNPLKGVWVVQGAVGYPLDLNVISGRIDKTNMEFLNIIRQSAMIHFPIGDIEVVASREGVSYSEYTINNINTALTKARSNIKVAVEAQVAALSAEGYKAATELAKNEALRNLMQVTGVKWENLYFTAGTFGVTFDVEKLFADMGDTMSLTAYSRRWRRGRYRWDESGRAQSVSWGHSGGYPIVARDTAEKPVVRLREYMDDVSGNTFYVLSKRDGSVVSDADLAEIRKLVGNSFTVDSLADVDLPTVERTKRTNYKVPTAYEFEAGDDITSTRFWTRVYDKLADFEDGGYYLIVDRHTTDACSDTRFGIALFDRGLLDRPIYAVREKDAKKLANNPLWRPLREIGKEHRDAILASKTFRNAYIASSLNVHDVDSSNDFIVNLVKEMIDNGEVKSHNVGIGKLMRISRTVKRAVARAERRGFSGLAKQVYNNTACDADTIVEALNTKLYGMTRETRNQFPLLTNVHTTWIYPEDGTPAYRGVAPEVKEHAKLYIKLVAGE